jgi:hypothetical protein
MALQKNRKKIKYLTVSAMLCALSVIVLMLGALVEVMDISVAVIASFFCIYAVIEMSGIYPWLIWLATTVLSFILLGPRSPILFYTCFAGYYPILKEKLEKHPNRIAIPLKLVIFHVALVLMYGGAKLFLPSILEDFAFNWMLLGLYVASVAVFLVYDYALTKLISTYLYRLRNRFHIK